MHFSFLRVFFDFCHCDRIERNSIEIVIAEEDTVKNVAFGKRLLFMSMICRNLIFVDPTLHQKWKQKSFSGTYFVFDVLNATMEFSFSHNELLRRKIVRNQMFKSFASFCCKAFLRSVWFKQTKFIHQIFSVV